MSFRRAIFALPGLLVLCPGIAAGDDSAVAQQLFQQGRALMNAGDLRAACPKFEGAAQLSPTPGVRLNLADCWAKMGRTASAWAKFEEASAVAQRNGDQAAADAAKKEANALLPALSYLTVIVPPEVAAEGVDVTRDGEPVPRAAWNTSVPVDPGPHTVVAQAAGHKGWTANVTVAERAAKVTVTVPLLENDVAPVVAPLPPSAPTESRGGAQRTAGWVVAGAGIVGLGVGAYFGISALSKNSSNDQNVGATGGCLNASCQTTSHDAYVAGNDSTVFLALGGALIATGAVLWLTAPRAARAATALSFLAEPHGGGLAVRGTWP
jgi:hypothetical protein